MTLAPGATVFVEATIELVRAPWVDETLDARWQIEPAQGRAFDIISNAPAYDGPLGVEVTLAVGRSSDGRHVVAGVTEPVVNSGRVELWAYSPGRRRATRIARVRVRDGEWSYGRFQPDRPGRWELYARYRASRDLFANDASQCGTFARVR